MPVYSKEVEDRVWALYEQGVSAVLIEKETGVPRDTITMWGRKRKWRRPTDGRKHPPELVAHAQRLWLLSDLTITAIEKETGVSRSTLLKWKKEYGWGPR